jgi:16S rRNA (guanine527-N7)-methyltransferase
LKAVEAGKRLQDLLAAEGEAILSADQAEAFGLYLELLLRWNARTNLTAIRSEGDILRRHFFESIYCARRLPAGTRTLLDFGSGSGFPGIPCALCVPGLQVTLAESQGKKASFLREVVRQLELGCVVHQGRVEDLRVRDFDAITLRAVDRMEVACGEAVSHLRTGGWLVILTTKRLAEHLAKGLQGLVFDTPEVLPGGSERALLIGKRPGSYAEC